MIAGACVLLVEDSKINQEVTVAMLSAGGVLVEVVGDGALAVEKVRGRRYDAILMDVHMPGMDGMEATRAIRQLPTGSDVPIIAMTGSAGTSDRDRCLEAGMNDHLPKPVEPEELWQVLERWIGATGLPDERPAP